MRVAVDGRSLARSGSRGIAHYTEALLAALGRLYPGDEWVVIVPGEWSAPPGVRAVRTGRPRRLRAASSALLGRPRIDVAAGGCDLVWAPAPAPLAVSPGVPLLLTVHDRSWELRPGDFTAYERFWHAVARPRRLAVRAARVVTDSRAVRADLIREWGLDAGRVAAVPLAPAVVPRTRTDSGRGVTARDATTVPVSAPYFLFAGALEPRKGVAVLARAYGLARERGLRAGLVVAGAGRLTAGLDQPGIECVGHVDDARLAELYGAARAVVLPSLLEGFGLPPVEAAFQSVPAIVSDLEPLRETLGADGALYVPPGDPEALATALLELERDDALRRRLGERARAATRDLSWDATAAATHALMVEAANR